MIAAVKAVAKRHWPALRLRTILLATLLFVAALPGFGALFLRVYENTLVRQTESELVAQGAALAAAASALWPGAMPRGPTSDYLPEPPKIDLSDTPVLAERPPSHSTGRLPDPIAVIAGARLGPIAAGTAQTTLASIILVDRSAITVLGPGRGTRFIGLSELDAALAGRVATVLRRNGDYRPRYSFEWLSRASALRIHHARPIVVGNQVVGALLLSRSPRALFRGIYEDRGKIALGVALIFGALLVLSGLLSRGIARPIEALGAATRSVALGQGEVPDPPVTAAVEIRQLYRDFGIMAAAIERRSRYLRDFATAVSHEFKTPLAAVGGTIELLEDHDATMTAADRSRFLANMAADIQRLTHLVQRLLDLARADMAQPQSADRCILEEPIATTADAFHQAGFEVEIIGLQPAPVVAVPASTIEAVIASLLENSRQAGATKVRISERVADDLAWLHVVDNGPGVPVSDQPRIFEPFFTSRRASGGTGLGLPIAQSLLKASLGDLELIERKGGAEFVVKLPIFRGSLN